MVAEALPAGGRAGPLPPQSLTWLAAGMLVAGLLVAALDSGEPRAVFATAGLTSLAILFLLRPLFGLVAVVAIHQTVDLWADGQLQGVAGMKLNLSTGLTLLMVVVGGAYLAENHRRLRTAACLWPFAALVLVASLSLMTAPDLGVAVPEVLRLARIAIAYGLAYVLCREEREFAALLAALLVSVLPPMLVAIEQAVTGTGGVALGEFQFVRATGGFPEPDQLGIVAALALTMAVTVLVSRGVTWWWRAALAGYVAIAGVALVASYGRTGWIALAAGLVVVGIVARPVLLLLVPAAVLCIAIAVPNTVDRFNDLDAEPTYQGHYGNTFNQRVELWRDNLPKLNDSPLVGGGLGSIDDREGRLVHNDYIRAAVELGLLGFAAFVCLLLAALGGAVAAHRRIRSAGVPGLLKAMAAGGIGVSIAFMVICVTSNVLTKPVTAGLAFTLVALAHAAGRRRVGTAG